MSTALSITEEALWFGDPSQPLFGWLTTPGTGKARGSVLLAPTVGRQARASRRAMRHLAYTLAERGYLALRFDYHGTGDADGVFDDPEPVLAWTESVAQATEYLRSLGTQPLSAVGLRLGGTLLAEAAGTYELGLTSLVFWDACESGRSYLRELSALEALRWVEFVPDPLGTVETPECVFSSKAASDLRGLKLATPRTRPLAERILVMTRADRPISESVRTRFESEAVEWETTTEQGPMLDVDLLAVTQPDATRERIVDWLCDRAAPLRPYQVAASPASAVVHGERGLVRERVVRLGPNELFGIVTEPLSESQGPWIVMLDVANEEHTGPARLWVELSRRWADFGLRCVRFDLSGVGDSPWKPGDPDLLLYDPQWTSDVADTAAALSPDDPSNTVFVGLCSGAYLGAEAALSIAARGACLINPPVGIDFHHGLARLERSRNRWIRTAATRVKQLTLWHRWGACAFWEVGRAVLPSALFVDLIATIVDNGTEVLVLASKDDLTPNPDVPFLRSVDKHRVVAPRNYRATFVPGLDHSMHSAGGRARAVAIVDHHILERYADVEANPRATEGF